MASAQAPFVSITSPAANTVIGNISAPLNVTVQFGNAPTDCVPNSLLIRAFDSNDTLVNQNATLDLSLIPWQRVSI